MTRWRALACLLVLSVVVHAEGTRALKSKLGITLEYPASWRIDDNSDGPPGWDNAMPELWYGVCVLRPGLDGKGWHAKVDLMVAHIDPKVPLETRRDQKLEVYKRGQDNSHVKVRKAALGTLPGYCISYDGVGKVMNVSAGKMEDHPNPTWPRAAMPSISSTGPSSASIASSMRRRPWSGWSAPSARPASATFRRRPAPEGSEG